MTLHDLEKAALELDHRSRARLAERLLASLDELAPAELEALWLAEAAARAAAWERGETRGVSAAEVLDELAADR